MRGDRQDQQKKLSDEQLVLNAQSDKTAIGELIARYICTVEFLAKKYGAEVHEDLVQEGLMGLLGAVRTYREDKNAKFSTYATKCIKNKIISSVHRNALLSGGEEAVLEAILGGGGTVPEEVVVEREELNELYDKITSALSEQECPYIVTVRRKGQYVSRLIVGDVYAVAGIDEQVTVFFHQQIGFRLQLPCLSAAGEDRHLVGVPFLIYKDIGLAFHTAP